MTFPVPGPVAAALASPAQLLWLFTASHESNAAPPIRSCSAPTERVIDDVAYAPTLAAVSPWNAVACNIGAPPTASVAVDDANAVLFDIWSTFPRPATTATLAVSLLAGAGWTAPQTVSVGAILDARSDLTIDRELLRITFRPRLYARRGGRLRPESGAVNTGAFDDGNLQTVQGWTG